MNIEIKQYNYLFSYAHYELVTDLSQQLDRVSGTLYRPVSARLSNQQQRIQETTEDTRV